MKIRVCAVAVIGLLFAAAPVAVGQSATQIDLTDQQVSRLGIEVEIAAEAGNAVIAELPARVVPARSGMSVVSAPYEGTVLSVSALPGQSVRRGDVLFEIASRDFVEDRSGLEQARAELEVAKVARERQERLVDEGIAARGSLEGAFGRERTALAMVTEHEQSLPSSVQSGGNGTYKVKAPVDGIVASVDVAVGDNASAMSALLMLNSSSDLWADVQIPMRLIGNISPEDLILYPGGGVGAILSIQKVIDQRSRAGSLIATVPASENIFQGQLLTVQVARYDSSQSLVVVPAGSVVRIDGVDRVFRRRQDGFTLVDVDVRGSTDNTKILKSAIAPGDQIASRGLVELKAIALQGMN